jgi:hypothetical protein
VEDVSQQALPFKNRPFDFAATDVVLAQIPRAVTRR